MRKEGIALVLALATLVILSTLGTVIFVRTLGEMRHSRADAGIVQTLLLARGAAGAAGALLGGPIRERLSGLVASTASGTSCWAYGGNTNCTGESPDEAQAARDLQILARRIQSEVDGLICNQSLAPSGLDAAVRVRVHFSDTACGQGLPPSTQLPAGRFVEGSPRTGLGTAATQTYALPFVLVAEARVKEYQRNLILQGEYRFTVGRSSFARYALFTNVHALPNGIGVWFTDRTLFDGPVHTNGHFRFYRTPWFGGEGTSAGCTNPGRDGCNGQINAGGYFYGTGFRSVSQMPDPARPRFTNWYGTHAPLFNGGVDWNAGFVPLPQNSQDQRGAAQSQGLYFPQTITRLRLFTFEFGATKWQYIEVTYCTNNGCSATKTEVYRYGEDGLLFQKGANGVFSPVYRNGSPLRFNGVIHTDGEVRSLEGPSRQNPNDPETAPPALAEFAQITVSSSGAVRISTDLKYERPPCTSFPARNPDGSVTPARCTDLGARNVLGVYSQNGDVLISKNAPRDLYIHATLMSARGVVGVEGYNSIPAKGNVHLLGGIIQYYYGAFGTFNAATGKNQTGYGRAFAYDPRFQRGLAPPFFPTTGQDRVVSVSLFSFGQREQVY